MKATFPKSPGKTQKKVTLTKTPAYRAIQKACLEIAYANGGINCIRSEKRVIKEINSFLSSRPYNDQFIAINSWLAALTNDELEIVCDGEQTEMEALLLKAPPFTDKLLNEYFDEVC